MEILRMMAADRLSKGEWDLVLDPAAAECLERECFTTLGKIRDILADDTLEDPECFDKIERIVCEMESLGLNCGGRHDFG